MKSLRDRIVEYRDAPEAAKPTTDMWLRQSAKKAPAGEEILAACQGVAAMLIEKNIDYGNSALEPVRIFSRAPADEQIRVRLDDKISRLARGQAAGEDTEADLIGYLVLLKVLEVRGAEVPSRRGEADHAGVRDRGVGADSSGEAARESRDTPSASENVRRELPRERDGGASDTVSFLPQPGRCQSCNTSELSPESVICEACAKTKGFGRGTNGASERTSEVVLTNRK